MNLAKENQSSVFNDILHFITPEIVETAYPFDFL